MKNGKGWIYAAFIGVSEVVGIIAGLLTKEGVSQIQEIPQSALTPPGSVFMIVWPILYALMGIGAARVWMTPMGELRTRGIGTFFLQLLVNFFWSLFFFNLQAYGFSFLWILILWGMILGMILLFRKVDPLAAWLQIPYILWLLFATFLTISVWRLNR